MIFLMKSKINNERFVLVGENKSFKEVLFNIADNFGKKQPFIKVTKFLAELAWVTDFLVSKMMLKEVSISKQSARSSLNKYEYSSEKIKKQLGFEFENIQNVIQNTCQMFLKDTQ